MWMDHIAKCKIIPGKRDVCVIHDIQTPSYPDHVSRVKIHNKLKISCEMLAL